MEDRRKLLNEFLEAYPLETLNDMPLDKYSNLNKSDSFCYWMESRTCTLGSIRGGSAYKFGIYKYNERPKGTSSRVLFDDTYAWYSKHGQTAEEAYARIRSEVVKIATHARDCELEAIDKITTFGEVFKWKIAFLYSEEHLIPIYSREKLETVAAALGADEPAKKSIPYMQRFLLKKKGDKDLFVFYDQLLQMIGNKAKPKDMDNNVKPTGQKYWMYAPGEGVSKWALCQKDNIICIGWDELGDLCQYESLESVREHMKDTYGKPNSSFKNDGLAVWEFVQVMKPGDVVYVKSGITKIVGRGVVKSDYCYDESYEDFLNVRKVEWTHLGLWDAPSTLVQKTLTDISKYPDLVKKLERLFSAPSQKRYWWLVSNPKIWSMDALAVGSTVEYELYNDNGKPRRVQQNFLNAQVGDVVIGYESTPAKQIVALAEVSRAQNGTTIEFQKKEALKNPIDLATVKAIEGLKDMQFLGNPQGSFFELSEMEFDLLLDLIRESNIAPVEKPIQPYTKECFLKEVFMNEASYDSLCHLLHLKKNIILQGAPGVGKTFTAKRLAYSMIGHKEIEQVEMVQFHQNYSYEDFIMGYKPTEDGGFTLRPGIFYNFCKKAKCNPEKDYFFIIDEINRGNLSKVFGELLMLIENNYRDERIKLAYSGEDFCVPKNVYLIGLMNTADRSLAMIDYALRRRFSFIDIEPGFDTEGFKHYQTDLHHDTFDKVIEAIKQLNSLIAADDSLGPGFCIGHSYFCEQKAITQEWLENVVNYDIAPMLKEYWFDDPQKSKTQIENIKNALK